MIYLNDTLRTYECPMCGETLTEEEAGSVPDEGCPICRRVFDWSDYN